MHLYSYVFQLVFTLPSESFLFKPHSLFVTHSRVEVTPERLFPSVSRQSS